MAEAQINRSLALIIYVFKILGILPKSENDLRYRKVWTFTHKFNYIAFQILLLSFAFTSKDKNEAAFVVLIYICVFISFVKILYVLSNHEEILAFLSNSLVDVSNSGSEIKKEVIEKERIFMKWINAYLVLTTSAILCLIISSLPIFTTGRKLPFYITFSLKWKHEAIVHWILHIMVSWSAILSDIYNFVTIFVWYILYNYSVQYKILGQQFRNLGATGNSCFLRDLISLMKIHRNLYE